MKKNQPINPSIKSIGITAAGPTRGIKQHYVLPGVDAAFLHERRGNLLGSLVKLNAGRRAHCHTLQDGKEITERDRKTKL